MDRRPRYTCCPAQVLVKVLGSPNLYWEVFSRQPAIARRAGGLLEGLLRTGIQLAPFTLMMVPTIYIYYTIVR